MAFALSFKVITWQKDSHSLFNYESTEITENNFFIALPESNIGILRKKHSNSINITNKLEAVDLKTYDIISNIKLKRSQNVNSCCLEFSASKDLNKKNERLITDESNSSSESDSSIKPKEEAYIVVSKLKDPNGKVAGCKLHAGHIVKLGKIEYFVSEICFKGKKFSAISKSKFVLCNKNLVNFSPDPRQKEKEGKICKICFEETETKDNFLFNPCKFAELCGAVHIECLQHWIQIKVKKEMIDGITHFNFKKIYCEICFSEVPMIIKTNNRVIKLLPIQKIEQNYIVLEGACSKTKSVMLIQNPPKEGINLGRGDDCEIIINDISVSRHHAKIKENANGFYIYDNKSKFGTLIKDENCFSLEVGNIEKGIQIGRTLVLMHMKPINPLNERH